MSSIDAKFSSEIFRTDRKVVLASNRQLASLLPARLAYDALGYSAGVVLARNSVSGLHQKYDNGGASGLDTAVGILMDGLLVEDFLSASDTQSAKMIVGGECLEANLTGLDSAAKTDLGGRSITLADGTVIFKF